MGVPLPGVMARIWSEEDEAPPGTDGEIQIRGPQVFGGYSGDPAATAAAFAGDDWFRTGDIGCLDPRTGHLLIRGRSKEMIITGGLNVYPREVELVLESHPAVAEAAVAGVPHDHWGEQVTAWVVLRPGIGVRRGRTDHARTHGPGELQDPEARLPAAGAAAQPRRQGRPQRPDRRHKHLIPARPCPRPTGPSRPPWSPHLAVLTPPAPRPASAPTCARTGAAAPAWLLFLPTLRVFPGFDI